MNAQLTLQTKTKAFPPMKPSPDYEWITLFQEGDNKAFGKVFKLYYQPLCYFTFKLIQDYDFARDIVSESFQKLWLLRANFNTLVNIRAFLYITCRNNALNHLRSLQRQKPRVEAYSLQKEEKEESQLHLIIEAELIEEIYKIIDLLPEKRREVLKLFYLEDLKIEEIAARLDMNPATVSTNKFKAMEQLRRILFTKKELLVITLFFIHILYCFLGR